jgi:hydrogenase expression/formation protein HypD
VVSIEGNLAAQALIKKLYQVCDRNWRGIGMIQESGLCLRPEYVDFDAEKRFPLKNIMTSESKICISGQILQGLRKPPQCPAFGTICSPEKPLGATMVSFEGACAAYYRYARS